MKKNTLGLAIIAAGTALSAPALAAPPICLSTQDMTNTDPQKDGKAIMFHMRDGSVWRNDLQGACPDLRFDGFEWTVRNPDYTVCENMQSLRVLRSGEICVLGKFTQVTAPKKSN